jgi:hypothetical protein
VLVYLFWPETKALTLEEMETVFGEVAVKAAADKQDRLSTSPTGTLSSLPTQSPNDLKLDLEKSTGSASDEIMQA